MVRSLECCSGKLLALFPSCRGSARTTPGVALVVATQTLKKTDGTSQHVTIAEPLSRTLERIRRVPKYRNIDLVPLDFTTGAVCLSHICRFALDLHSMFLLFHCHSTSKTATAHSKIFVWRYHNISHRLHLVKWASFAQ